MRNKFTLVLMTMAIVFTGIFATQTAESAERKIVLEDHTGAWCGWCPRGMETLETLENEFGEEIIGVGVHNNDAMAISTYQTPLAQMIGLAGYPNGSVNRIVYGGKIAQSDNVWATIARANVGQDVPVGVKLDVDYDKATGDYTATITATVESAVNAPLAFNLWILQDYMTGSGQGWDQANYLSNRSGFENSKYYSQPSVIPNFIHMDVFRAAHGGTNGDQGTFPAGMVPAGEYTQKYTGNVSNMNVTDKNNAFFVAVVHNQTTKEIINADRVGKVIKEKEKLTLSTNNQYTTVASNDLLKTEVVITNDQEWDITADLEINTSGSLIPTGWTVSLDKTSIMVTAGQTAKVNVLIEKNAVEGYGQIKIDIMPQPSADRLGINDDITMYYMTENIKDAMFFNYDNGVAPILSAINTSGELNGVAPVALTPETLTNFPQMKNFETVIFTVTDASFALSTTATKANVKYLEDLMDGGADILIAVCYDLINYGDIFTDLSPTPEVVDFFKNRIGVNLGTALVVLQNNQLVPVAMTGVSGDPIGNGMNFNYNASYNQSSYPFYAQYFSSVSLNGNTNATAFLEANPAISTNMNNTNNKVGVKLDNDGQRTVLFTVALDPMGLANLNTVMKPTIAWLKGSGNQAAGPKIGLSTSQVVFGEVKLTETGTETITINNDGDETLEISEINLKDGDGFNVKSGSLPISIDAGQTVNLSIEFTPTVAVAYSDEITFVSNDKASPNKVITVKGVGLDATASVPGVISDLFDMTITPNPVVDNSQINFNVKGSANVSLELIDATGRVVNSLFNGVTTGASVNLNASQLSSGNYYINANVDGKTTQMPVVITK